METTILLYVRQLQQLADAAPDKPMVISGQHITTRQELLTKAQRVAVLLRERHQGDCAFFPIALPNSADYLAAELGVWMSGNASVHIGDSFPRERVRFIIADCKAPFVIDRDFMLEAETRALPSAVLPPHSRTESQPCAMFYTSGSTGTPKGVLHSDRGLMESIANAAKISSWSEDDIFGSLSPFYFMAICFVYEALYKGICVDIISQEAAHDIIALEHHLRSHHITTTFISPSVMRVLNVDGLSMRQIRVGGDRASLLSPFAGCELCNCYGQTEMAGTPFHFHIDKAYDNTPVGRPCWSGVEAVIVDEQGNPVADGQDGELCLKGITPPTYFGDREKTEALMRGGMFHTGDIFRRLPTGDYLYVNRNDWMLKINGQRVEPGEVEVVMRKVDGVAEAVVKGFSDNHGSKYLVGYYTVKTNSAVTSDDISHVLQQSLPAYMIPAFLVKLDAFPLNSHGKTDRMALTSPADGSLQTDYVAPTNDAETQICQAFARVLGLDRVGIDDDFIRMGGDSISIMRVQSECPALQLSSKTVYQYRTPRRIAEALQLTTHSPQSTADNRQPAPADYPLNDVQQTFYNFSKQLPPGVPLFNYPVLYRLGDGVDLQRLCRAIDAVVAAHPSMTMTIIEKADGAEPRLVYDRSYSFHTSVEVLSDAAFAALQPTLLQAFQLTGAPMLRIRLYQTDTGKYLFYDFHHLIFDGMSLQVFHDDINKAYAGEEIPVEEATIYELNAEEQQAQHTPSYTEARAWFTREFGDAPKETIPTPDRVPQPIPPTFGSLRRRLNIPSHGQLEAACKELGVTPNVLFMAAGAQVIGHYSNTTDVLLSASYHARGELRQQRTFGFLAKPRLMRFRWHEGEPARAYLQRSKQHIMDNMARDVYPITHLMAHLGLSQNMVLFMYEGALSNDTITLCGEKATKIELSNNLTASPLCYYIYLMDDGTFDVLAVYAEQLYSEAYILQTISSLSQTVSTMIAAASRQPSATSVEDFLCRAFAEVTGFTHIGPDDDFFHLGGNSIQMMRLQQLCAESHVEALHTMSVRTIRQGRTPKGIAALLSNTLQPSSAIRRPSAADYPLNGIQQSYFQICQQHAGQPMFNVSNLIALHAATDMQRLAQAIETVVANHPGLHARLFENAEGEVRQKFVAEPYSVSVEHTTEADFEFLKPHLVQPFRLLATDSRLFRFRLFETEKRKYMFYDIHHIIYDGASQTILFRDIEQAYQGKTIAPEDWTLFDMAAEESSLRQTDALQQAQAWYRATFADAIPLYRPDIPMPTAGSPQSAAQGEKPSPHTQTLTSLTTTLDVPLGAMQGACQSVGVTMNALTTAAFALLLGKQAHTSDVVFASAYNAREDSRVRHTIGLFARPLFIRTRWTEHTLTKDFLQNMRSNLLECMENSIYSYAEMQADIPLSPGYLFIYQGDLTAEPVIGGHPTQAVTIAEKQAISAIEAHLFLDSDEKHLKMEMLYKQDFYSEEYIKSMVTDYQTVLNGLMTTMHLSDIEI